MKNLFRRTVASLMLLIVSSSIMAESFWQKLSDDAVATYELNYRLYEEIRSSYPSDSEAQTAIVQKFSSWKCPSRVINRANPYLYAQVRVGCLQNMLKGMSCRAEVYVEWNRYIVRLGEIECYPKEWKGASGRQTETFQFYKVRNLSDNERSPWVPGTFYVTPVPTEESGRADVANFFFFPSAQMIQDCMSRGGNTRFNLRIEAKGYSQDVNWNMHNGEFQKIYTVNYLLNDCQLEFPMPETPSLDYSESLDRLSLNARYEDFDKNTFVSRVGRRFYWRSATDYDIAFEGGPTNTIRFEPDNGNVSREWKVDYDLANREGAPRGNCRISEKFRFDAMDDVDITDQSGDRYSEIPQKYSRIVRHGFEVTWPSRQLSLLPLFSARTAGAQFDSDDRTVKITWQDGEDETKTIDLFWGGTVTYREKTKTHTPSEVHVYRAELEEGAEPSVNGTNWKHVYATYLDYNGTRCITDKDLPYNKRFAYAVTVLPENVNEADWSRDRTSLPPALTTLLTLETTPTINVNIQQDLTVRDHIAFTFAPSKIPCVVGKAKFQIYRRLQGDDDAGWRRLEEMELTNDGRTKGYFRDNTAEGCTVYEYKVSTYVRDEHANIDNTLESTPVPLTVIERSHVTHMDATKGERDNSVLVTWDAKQVGTMTTTYEVKRRPANTTEDYQTIHTLKGTANRYSYEDKTADAGQYYEYKVEAYTEGCKALAPERETGRRAAAGGDGLTFSNAAGEIGYSQAKAVISGRVSYGSGTSVGDVKVSLARQADDQDSKLISYSQLLKNGGTISWETTARQMHALAGEHQPFTLQMWLQPMSGQKGQPIVSVPGLGSFLVSDNDTVASLSLAGQTFKGTISTGGYSHLTLTVNGNDVALTINGDTLGTEHIILPEGTWQGQDAETDKVQLVLGGIYPGSDQRGFTGYMREVRLWSRLLKPAEVVTTYDRPLSGLETGLAIYWPLDEGLSHHAFDVSCTGGVKNKRHPSVAVSVEPSTRVPTASQLSLYGVTNANGEYTIRGVPFTGTGNTYVITPLMEGHEFLPTTLNAFVNKQALSLNNNDFTDKSSFEYTGTVTYANTDIPVDSVTFEIDGMGVVQNGKPVMTDAQGHFTLSVPIGSHSIQAVRANHTLSRYPETGTADFTGPGNLYFADHTLVNVAGRVNGGIDDQTAPLGFQQSVNRLGVATVTLGLGTETNNRFNLRRQADGTWKHQAKETHIDTYDANINSTSYYSQDNPTDIIVKTDPLTGEFSAMLPPLPYQVKSIRFVDGSPYNDEDFFRQNLPVIDARNPTVKGVDTLYIDGKKKEYPVQGRMVLNYRRNPIVTVEQIGMPEDAFGEAEVDDPDDEEKSISLVNTVTEAEAEANPALKEGAFKSYKYFNHPIFVQGRKYKITIGAREYYDYYNDEGEKTRTYMQVPSDGIIHINNSMSAYALVADETTTYDGKTYQPGDHISANKVDVSVSADGLATYIWVCGSPNFSDDHTLTATFSFEAAKKVTSWEGSLPQKDGTLRGIVLGSYTTGKRFITEGPQQPTYVLRDPGGAGSSASLQNDTIKTSYNSTSMTRGISEKLVKTINAGVYTKFQAGSIVANVVTAHINEINNIWSTKIGEAAKFSNVTDEASTIITTTSEKVSTPSDKTHVGRLGDTYIGRSTNIFYGDGQFLKLKKKADGTLALADSTGLTAGISLGTSYYYNEYHLVKVLIPEWKRVRNLTLERIDSWAEVPKPSTIKDGRKHYYTIYKEGDARFGKTNPGTGEALKDYFWTDDANCTVPADANYIVVVPPEMESFVDTISFFNQNIANWEGIIAQNEDDKVEAIKKGGEENISFSGGQVITKSHTETKAEYDHVGYTSSGTLNLGIKTKNKTEVNKVGGILEFEFKSTTTWGSRTYDISEQKNVVSYTLSDGNALSALSISVYDSPRGWGPVFITQGGQTLIPYEGETRCEYSATNKGVVLDQATMKVEKCDVTVVNANVSDVPNGEMAFFTIQLHNNSETQSPSTYTIYPHGSNNLHGGSMSMDGLVIPSTGVSFFLPYGTTTKTFVLKQGDQSVGDLSYMFRLQSEDDTTHIYSAWKTLTAHFVPTSASVELQSELAVINTQTDSTTLTLRNLDRKFTGLKGVRLQYRRRGIDAWTLAGEWVMPAYKADYPSARVIPAAGNLTKRMKFMADGIYELRAQTFSLFGNSDVTYESDIITVVQDCRKPRVLGTPGESAYLTLLGRNDVHVTFDEPINSDAISQAANISIRLVEDGRNGYQDEPLVQVLDEADYSITLSDRDIYFSFRDAMLGKMHGGIYEFAVQDIPDQHGNVSDTIRWQMSVDFSSVFWLSKPDERVLSVGGKYIDTLQIASVEAGHTYSISGLPSWIQLSQYSGSTSEFGGIQSIILTVLPSAPIGKNMFTLSLTDEKGITDDLDYYIHVLSHVPDWTVDKDLYEDNMIVVGKVKQWHEIEPDGEEVFMVGAFDAEGNCRGVAYTDYVVKDHLINGVRGDDPGFLNMMVYGNPSDGDITFRIYEIRTGVTMDSVHVWLNGKTEVSSLPFNPSEVVGSYDEPTLFIPADNLIQNLVLKKGWNWTSIYLDAEDKTVEEVFADYAADISCIKTKTSFTEVGFDEAANAYVFSGDLASEKLQIWAMYKIYAKHDVEIPVRSKERTGRWSQILEPGWSWFGTPSYVVPLDLVFYRATPGDYIKGREGYASFTENNRWEGTLTAVLPGNGYQYMAVSDEELFVLGNAKQRTESAHPAGLAHEAEPTLLPDYSAFPDNMTLVMQVKRGDETLAGQTVNVYVKGTLRARATTNAQGLCYLTVAGDAVEDGAPLSISVPGAEVPQPKDLFYSNDAMVGTTVTPYILQITIPEIAAK